MISADKATTDTSQTYRATGAYQSFDMHCTKDMRVTRKALYIKDSQVSSTLHFPRDWSHKYGSAGSISQRDRPNMSVIGIVHQLYYGDSVVMSEYKLIHMFLDAHRTCYRRYKRNLTSRVRKEINRVIYLKKLT